MFLKYFALPLLIIAVAVIYWFVSYEPAGTAMLAIFGIAMAVMGWILVPTFGDVGPTAPVDPEWHERDSCPRIDPTNGVKDRTLRLPWRQSRQRSVRLTGTNAGPSASVSRAPRSVAPG
jgi:hypothetical protein